MKKGVVILLVLILVVCAFFVGVNTDFHENDNMITYDEATIESIEEYTTKVYEEYTTKVDEEYTAMLDEEGFNRFARFNVLLEIKDFYISDTIGESYVIPDYQDVNNRGYYLENPYVAPAKICRTKLDERHSSADWVHITSDEECLRDFDFIDNYTLSFGSGEYEESESLIIDNIIEANELCTIFEASMDRYGFENDESNLYFFAFRYEDMIEFETMGIGDKVYSCISAAGEGKTFSAFEDRIIYF